MYKINDMEYKSLLLLFVCFVSLDLFPSGHVKMSERKKNSFTVEYVSPLKVAWKTEKGVTNSNELIIKKPRQVTTRSEGLCMLSTKKTSKASILLDFGRELHGGLVITAAIRKEKKPVKIRVCFGESISEAMSSVLVSPTATNDHAMRDMEIQVPWLGSIEIGNTGFRFVRIDLLDKNVDLPLYSVEAAFKYRDIPYIGSFESSNKRLNEIWKTGAYTVHLNMQDYLWDGVKRDRLVWVGDMHPEVMTINSVFGENEVVYKSLDLSKKDTPLPGWMNGMCSYSLWWLIIQRDLYLYQGNYNYLKEQQDYINQLTEQVIKNIDGNKENLSGGTRFLDWPTSENKEVIHAGLQALMLMALEAVDDISQWLNDKELSKKCQKSILSLRKYVPSHCNNKQAAALLGISGLTDSKSMSRDIISKDGALNFSTFYGYYMLEAMAMAGDYNKALSIISDYWGGMLDLGATTFWEDFNYADLERSTRIDEITQDNKGYDIHAMGGDYCYKGLRHSFCHGWASGPTAWLSKHVLGIVPVKPGFKEVRIEPHLGDLEWVKGTFPTPYGTISVHHYKDSNGDIKSIVDLPIGVKRVK